MISFAFKRNIPNILTILRLILAPICIYFLIKDMYAISFLLFLLASITDFFDGFIARKYNYVSKFGAFLDPIADKFLVFGVFFTFFTKDIIIDKYILILILSRDLIVTIIRSVMQLKGTTMVTTKLAKVKTTIQFIVILIIFICLIFKLEIIFSLLYKISFIMGLITFYSGLDYLIRNCKNLTLQRSNL